MLELLRAAYREDAAEPWWAAGYDLLSVPPAFCVLFPVGFILSASVGTIFG